MFVFLDAVADVVELGEYGGQLVHVVAYGVEQEVVVDLDHDLGKLEYELGQLPLALVVHAECARGGVSAQLLAGDAGIARYGAYARVRVQHVHGRVALVLEHLVEREYVLAGAIVRQVGVLDAAVGDGLLSGGQLVGAQHLVALLLAQLGESARLALGEQIAQTHRLARACLELLLVLAEHHAEANVLDAVLVRLGPADETRRRENALHVHRLVVVVVFHHPFNKMKMKTIC